MNQLPFFMSLNEIFNKRKHSLYGYNTHKGIVAHIELYF